MMGGRLDSESESVAGLAVSSPGAEVTATRRPSALLLAWLIDGGCGRCRDTHAATGLASPASASSRGPTTDASARSMRGTCVYLSMKTSAFGTSRSPRWTTERPTQPALDSRCTCENGGGRVRGRTRVRTRGRVRGKTIGRARRTDPAMRRLLPSSVVVVVVVLRKRPSSCPAGDRHRVRAAQPAGDKEGGRDVAFPPKTRRRRRAGAGGGEGEGGRPLERDLPAASSPNKHT